MRTWGLSGVADLLRRTGWLWWRCWPWLVAIYLSGWLARYWSIKLAVVVAHHFDGFWGGLVMPLAILARLVTYVLMFLVLRSEMDFGDQDGDEDAGGSRFEWFVGILLRSILPVFVLFAAWRILLSDEVTYQSQLIDNYWSGPDLEGKSAQSGMEFILPNDWRVYVAIGIAFISRFAVTKFADKLPAWTQLVAVYLEALWLLLLLNAAANRLVGSPKWIAERRVISWYTEQKEQLLAHFGLLAQMWKWFSGTVGLVVPAVLLSMTWIAIAGTIYAIRPQTSWTGVGRAAFGQERGDQVVAAAGKAAAAANERWKRLPHVVQTRSSEIVQSLLGIAEKLADTMRLALHAGPVTGCFFVFAFMCLVLLDPNGAYFNVKVSEGYLWRWTVEAIGPHPWLWWASYRESIRAAIAVVIDPLRVCLVAAMYWHCVERVSQAEPIPA